MHTGVRLLKLSRSHNTLYTQKHTNTETQSRNPTILFFIFIMKRIRITALFFSDTSAPPWQPSAGVCNFREVK